MKIILNTTPQTFEFNKNTIVLKKDFLSLEDRIRLIGIYLNSYFTVNEVGHQYDIVGAKLSFALALLDMFTNVEIYKDEEKTAYDPEIINAIYSGLYNATIDNIEGFWDFWTDLCEVQDDVKKQYELGRSLETIMSFVSSYLKNVISNIPTNPEDVEKITQSLKNLASEVEQSPIKDFLTGEKR